MGAGEHVDRVDLQDAEPIDRAEQRRAGHRRLRPRRVEALGGEGDPARLGEGEVDAGPHFTMYCPDGRASRVRR